MRILYASFDEVPSFKGSSTHILSGLRAAIAKHEVTLVTLGDFALPGGVRLGNLRHKPLAIRERNYLRRGLIFQDKIRRIVAQGQFDVVHFRGPFEGLPLIKSGLPAVYEVNAFPSIELPYYYSGLPEHVLDRFREWESVCLNSAARIICPSERLRDCILERVADVHPDKVIVLRNGYDADKSSGRSTVSDNEQPLRGIYLGTLSPWQGILWSLKAFRDAAVPLTLDIYAPFQKLQWRRAERRIERYDLGTRVRLLPALNRSDLRNVFSRYDFGIAPLMKTERNTRQGCCPLKILDYMAHGLPIVASDLFVVRELLSDSGYPLFFQPGSVRSLRERLEYLALTRERIPQLSQNVRQMLCRIPSWDDYGVSLLSLYEELRFVPAVQKEVLGNDFARAPN